MSTEEPTAIDEKKAEEEGTTTDKASWPDFFKNLGAGLITGILIGVVFIGSMGLFLTKVANANILPTEIDALPYNPLKKRDIPIDLIYMNPVKQLDFFGLGFWDVPKSSVIQEANFYNPEGKLDFIDDFKNTWICSLYAKTHPKDGLKSAFWTFQYKILTDNLSMSFTILQKIFFYLNYLPEWGTMILFGLIFPIILTVINICNFAYSIIFSYISNIPGLAKNMFTPKELNPGAADNNYFDSYIAFCYVVFYLIIGFWTAILSPLFITVYTFYKALSANYFVRIQAGDQPMPDQKMNLYEFIKNVMYYKKTFIMILVMLNLMSVTNEYLGTSYMPGVVIAILILIFGLKILETPVPEELYTVPPGAVFPSLSQIEVPIKNVTDTDFCASKTIPLVNPTNQVLQMSVTNQPFNVLTKQKGGSIFKGGSKKTKLYNIQLV